MNPTFDKLYRQLGRGTFAVLLAALGFLGLALVAALLGFPHAVQSFRGAAASAAYVFAALLTLFLITSLVAAVIKRLERRS